MEVSLYTVETFSEKEWQVAVTTGDQEGSGTQAQVYLTIFGEQGDTGPLELGQPGVENFAQGTAGAELAVSANKIYQHSWCSLAIVISSSFSVKQR